MVVLQEERLTHPQEQWCDSIVIAAKTDDEELKQVCPAVIIFINERYKTSEISGNEWRFNYVLKSIENKQEINVEIYNDFWFTCCKGAKEYRNFKDISADQEYVITFVNRGEGLIQLSYETLLDALLALPCLLVEIPEQLIDEFVEIDKSLTKIRAERCSQPGCDRKPVVKMMLNKRYDDEGNLYDCEKIFYRQFCEEHSVRGNCSLEDADSNYSIILGRKGDENNIDPEKISKSDLVVIGADKEVILELE
jgi:hypothetical protein